MNTFTVLFFCIQACLIQSVFSQCTSRAAVAADRGIIGGYGLGAPYGLGLAGGCGLEAPYGWAGYADYGYPAGAYGIDAYGGIGEGNVAVAGELPVCGTTAVAGQVPIMGAVKFGGDVAAAGAVSIAGKCACDCGCAGAPYFLHSVSQCTSRAAVAADRGIIEPVGLRAPYVLDAPLGLAASYGIDALEVPYGLESPCAWSAPAIDFSPTSGGALPVSSASAVAPVGLAVASDNVYEGILAAAGELPFVGTVAVEGVLPTAGAGAVHHSCGDGINAMVSDKTILVPRYIDAIAPAPIAPVAAIAPKIAAPALGYRAGWADKGCGCGAKSLL